MKRRVKRKKKQKKTKKKDPIFFGYPWSVISKCPPATVGQTIECKRCGQTHMLRDGKKEFPAVPEGHVLVFDCAKRVIIGAIAGHLVVGIEDKIAPYYRMAFLLSDLLHVFSPITDITNDVIRKHQEMGIILRGDETIPVAVPLAVAKLISWSTKEGEELMKKLDFVQNQPYDCIHLQEGGSSLILPPHEC